jgi:hypothetical protein
VLLSRPYILFYKRKVIALMRPVMVRFGVYDDEEEGWEQSRLMGYEAVSSLWKS